MQQRHDVFWMELTERCWDLFWRVLGTFVVFVTIPSALMVGCKVIGIIVPRVTP